MTPQDHLEIKEMVKYLLTIFTKEELLENINGGWLKIRPKTPTPYNEESFMKYLSDHGIEPIDKTPTPKKKKDDYKYVLVKSCIEGKTNSIHCIATDNIYETYNFVTNHFSNLLFTKQFVRFIKNESFHVVCPKEVERFFEFVECFEADGISGSPGIDSNIIVTPEGITIGKDLLAIVVKLDEYKKSFKEFKRLPNKVEFKRK